MKRCIFGRMACLPFRQQQVTVALLFVISVVYSLILQWQFGQYPGENYDSYQYVYAAMRASAMKPEEIAEYSRLHVHSAHFPLWHLFARLGVSVWLTSALMSIVCTALAVAGIYKLSREQGCRHRHALMAAILFQSYATVAYYSNIPEVYAPWAMCLIFMLLRLEQRKWGRAGFWFAASIWLFLPSLLLLPAFLSPKKRSLTPALGGACLGMGLHLITLQLYGVPFFSRLLAERVYWQATDGWQWYIVSTWTSLAKSGMGLILAWSCLLLWLTRRRLNSHIRHLVVIAIPLFIAPALWVKDHGSFFLPLGILLSLLCPLLLEQWTQNRRWRATAVLFLLVLSIAANLRSSWRQISYDRKMGLTQMEFCEQALSTLPPESTVVSTALLSTWLYAKESTGRGDVQCLYFPWLVNDKYSTVLEESLDQLMATPGIYFVDPTVSSLVTEAGKLLKTHSIAVPIWPQGEAYWDLKAIYLGDPEYAQCTGN